MMSKKAQTYAILDKLATESALVKEAAFTIKEGLSTDASDVEKDLKGFIRSLNSIFKLSPDGTSVHQYIMPWNDLVEKVTQILKNVRDIDHADEAVIPSRIDPGYIKKIQESVESTVSSIQSIDGEWKILLKQTLDEFRMLPVSEGTGSLNAINALNRNTEYISSGLSDIAEQLVDLGSKRPTGREMGSYIGPPSVLKSPAESTDAPPTVDDEGAGVLVERREDWSAPQKIPTQDEFNSVRAEIAAMYTEVKATIEDLDATKADEERYEIAKKEVAAYATGGLKALFHYNSLVQNPKLRPSVVAKIKEDLPKIRIQIKKLNETADNIITLPIDELRSKK